TVSSFTVRLERGTALFPYTTLFRSVGDRDDHDVVAGAQSAQRVLVAQRRTRLVGDEDDERAPGGGGEDPVQHPAEVRRRRVPGEDRKSTRLNSSHVKISYAVFCLKK